MKNIGARMRAGMIAVLCMVCVLTAGVSWACRINYSLVGGTHNGGTLPTEEHERTYLAAAEMIHYELEGSLISPTIEDILDTCTDGCCYFSFQPLFMRACLDGSFCWKHCFSEPCDYEYCDTWDVVCPCDDDDDCDMVLDDDDLCPMTPEGETVDPAGCSISQLCPCDGPMDSTKAWKNHGKYISCVSKQSDGFVEMGLITEMEQVTALDEAAESGCGKKEK